MVKVLIADDDPVSRLVLTATLDQLGYEVLSVESGAEAWIAWQRHRFAIVISDWVMPDMDGLELCQRIRAAGRAEYTYVVLLTAMSGKQNFIAGLDAGADDFATKPFDPELLAARLRVAQRILDLQAQLLASREALRLQATQDALTGVANRRGVMETLEEEFRRAMRQGTPLATLLIDIDHFKRINDSYGHPVGDLVLVEATRRMSDCLRPYDRIGRYGGEEFLVVVPGCDTAGAEIVANRIHGSLKRDVFRVCDHELLVTASVGVAHWRPGDSFDADGLLRAADDALYQAKDEGRNRVCLAGPPGTERAVA